MERVASKTNMRASATLMAPLVFVLLWSTGPVATRIGVADVSGLDLLTWRFAALAVIAAGYALATRRLGRLPPMVIAHCAIAGVLIQAMFIGSVFVALDMGMSAGMSALLTGLQPVAAAVCARWLLGERLGRIALGGMVLAAAGLVVYAGHRVSAADLTAAPLALHVAGVIAIGVGLVYQRRFCNGVALTDNLAIQYLAGAAAVALFVSVVPSAPSQWTPAALAALVWLVAVLSVGATALLLVLSGRGRVSSTASLFFLMPPTTAVIAAPVLGEQVTPTAVTGLVVTSAGVAVVMHGHRVARRLLPSW